MQEREFKDWISKAQLTELDVIGALMLRKLNAMYGQEIFDRGLEGEAKAAADKMITIYQAIQQHLQKQGSLENLKVSLGLSAQNYDQNPFIANSFVDAFLALEVTPAMTADLNQTVWPSAVEGLVITREPENGFFRYYLMTQKDPGFQGA